jgi:hypothetical protein
MRRTAKPKRGPKPSSHDRAYMLWAALHYDTAERKDEDLGVVGY